VANTPAYYDTVTITAVKSFIVQAPAYQMCLSNRKFGNPIMEQHVYELALSIEGTTEKVCKFH